MEELLDYEPDLFIVYSGNNEFLERRTYQDIIEEPAPLSGGRWVLSHSRTYGLVEKIIRRPEEKAREKYELTGEVEEILNRSTGLDVYHRDDMLKAQILSHYRFNLRRMVHMAGAARADVIMVTIPANEKDFAPFKSQPSEGLTPPERERFQTLTDDATLALEEGHPDTAQEHLDNALRIDVRYADAHYLMGKALMELGAHQEAEKAFRTAIQEDVCPLRALVEFNDAIVEVTRENDVALVDFRTLLKKEMLERFGHEILGEELFLDHVHPTVETNGRLARALVDRMAGMGLVELEPSWHDRVGDAVAADVESRVDDAAYARAFKNLSKVLIWAGKKKEAERYVRQAEEQLTEDWEAHLNAGILSLGSENYQEALVSLKEAIRLNPEAAVAHNYLSAVYAARGELDEAIAHAERAVEIDPGLAIAHNNLGTYFTSKGDLERARAAMVRALKLDPEYPEAYNNLGNVHFKAGRLDEASSSFEKALSLRPNYIEALVNRGLLLGERGRFPEAIESFSKALALDSDSVPALVGLGRALFANRQVDEAQNAFQKAVQLEASSPTAYEWLARCLVVGNQAEKAKEVLNRGLKVSPNHPSLHHLYGQILGQEEKYDEAIQHLEAAIAASVEYSEDVVALDALHYALAGALLMSEQVDKGLLHLKRALSINPRNFMVLNDLGLVNEQLGRLEEALSFYQQALEIEPSFTPAAENLKRVKQRLGIS
jgi:tetratricopeptide (TPR) repeat protein